MDMPKGISALAFGGRQMSAGGSHERNRTHKTPHFLFFEFATDGCRRLRLRNQSFRYGSSEHMHGILADVLSHFSQTLKPRLQQPKTCCAPRQVTGIRVRWTRGVWGPRMFSRAVTEVVKADDENMGHPPADPIAAANPFATPLR